MENRYEAFTLLLASITRRIRRIKTDAVSEYGLKSPHVTCLYYLYKHPGALTAAELCELCDEDKAAISRSILYLEQNGFLVRVATTLGELGQGSAKHYRAPLTLTEKGVGVARYIAERIDRVLEQVAEGVTEEERATLYRTLEKIDRNLREVCKSCED